MDWTAQAILLLVGAPLFGSLLSYLLSLRFPRLSGVVATGAAFASALAATNLFRVLGDGEIRLSLWEWFSVFDRTVRFEFVFDHLSAVMCLVVTWVGSIIHLYSIGYMAEDESKGRFFAYLNLFLFSMLILVVGASLPVMFIGWEGVGLCSYLLIGFWYRNQDYSKAGQKAFVMNRVGDVGFLIGMYILAQSGLSLDFSELQSGIGDAPQEILNVAGIAFFLAAAGKSAQIPLFTWLPDAMAGPTPVSALIHAATMVTAGVYLFARMYFVLDGAPIAQELIVFIGSLTAFVAATSAITQRDIKKVLAYSTVSQLGFMFMAIGAGAYSAAIFHVVTHAFFKALLFLAAGSVIHGCHHEQLLEKLGGLWKKMPLTFVTYLIGTLAISGVPFFSGAYSKDLILEHSFMAKGGEFWFGLKLGHFAWALGVVTAGITAFYMFRSLVLTFFGTYKGEHEPHESSAVMTTPLVLLAIPAAMFGGYFGDELLDYLREWSGPHLEVEGSLAYLEHYVLLSSAAGIVIAILLFGFKNPLISKLGERYPGISSFLERAWVFDEFYQAFIVHPLDRLSSALSQALDRAVIDGIVNGTGTVIEACGELVSRCHTGRLSQFSNTMLASFVFFLVFLFLLR